MHDQSRLWDPGLKGPTVVVQLSEKDEQIEAPSSATSAVIRPPPPIVLNRPEVTLAFTVTDWPGGTGDDGLVEMLTEQDCATAKVENKRLRKSTSPACTQRRLRDPNLRDGKLKFEILGRCCILSSH